MTTTMILKLLADNKPRSDSELFDALKAEGKTAGAVRSARQVLSRKGLLIPAAGYSHAIPTEGVKHRYVLSSQSHPITGKEAAAA